MSVDKSAMGRRANNKGTTYERDVIKVILEHFNRLDAHWVEEPDGVVHPIKFKYGVAAERPSRTGTGRPSEKLDMLVKDPLLAILFPFAVECKKEEGWTLDTVFRKGPGDLEKWKFVQYLERTRRYVREDQCPIVIFSRNVFPNLVMISTDDVTDRLTKKHATAVMEGFNAVVFDATSPEAEQLACVLAFTTDERNYLIMDLETFLEAVACKSWVMQKAEAFGGL